VQDSWRQELVGNPKELRRSLAFRAASIVAVNMLSKAEAGYHAPSIGSTESRSFGGVGRAGFNRVFRIGA
jgi:hypothetical protein